MGQVLQLEQIQYNAKELSSEPSKIRILIGENPYDMFAMPNSLIFWRVETKRNGPPRGGKRKYGLGFLIPFESMIFLRLEKKRFGNLQISARWRGGTLSGFVSSRNSFLSLHKNEKFKQAATAIQDLLEDVIPQDKLEIIDRN
jgi:hypothetical protein